MGIRVIGQKKFEVTETELLQQDLLFYLDNPRVYSVLHENGHDNPTQTEIEEIMCSLDHVKSLKSQIMQNGGLIEPLIVVKRKDRYVVLEGNSRLAAYRILAKNDPLKWSRVLVQILPEDISDSDIFTLLGTFHLNPKKDWSKFEQAAYIYRQKKELGCSDSALGKQVGISAITVKKYCEIYGLMVEHNDTHQSHWNMYEQYVQNKYPAEDAYFTYMTRGCGMNCTFCAVKTLEPTYEPYVSISDSIKRIDKEFGPKRDLLLMDNNVLRSPKFDQIIDEIKALGFEKGATFVNPKTGKTVVRHVDFNQGLDAFLLNEHKAQRLGELAIKPARIAFDHIEDEDVYVRAITLCARAGIDHMSNYLLYNGEDFTGKGHSYHADTPEDLFYRMHLTMELGENLTEELGRKIAIFSFPMRYIPLDNDQRGFIGANWNAKYLRALQCMLIPTQGKGIQGRSFFEADFGKTAEDFVMYLAMPERLLNKRGHFVERKDEPKFEREIRYTQWSENRHLIDTWMKYYSMFEKDTVLEYIGCNRFSVETLDKIENEELKKLYFFYLTPSATIRVFSDCTEDTKRIISTFILEELPFMYSRIVETILSSKPGYKVIAGILENFGEKVCTDLLKKIDLFSGHDNDKLTMLIKANKSKRLVDFDFSLLQFIPYFHVSNLLSKQEEQIIMNSAYELKEAPIRKILLLHLDELKDVLIKTNGAQPGDTQIISVIEEQIKELYHQISIFEL